MFLPFRYLTESKQRQFWETPPDGTISEFHLNWSLELHTPRELEHFKLVPSGFPPGSLKTVSRSAAAVRSQPFSNRWDTSPRLGLLVHKVWRHFKHSWIMLKSCCVMLSMILDVGVYIWCSLNTDTVTTDRVTTTAVNCVVTTVAKTIAFMQPDASRL